MRAFGCLRLAGELLLAALFLGVGHAIHGHRGSVEPGLRPAVTLLAAVLVLTGLLPLLASRAPRVARAVALLWLLGFLAIVVLAVRGG